MRRIVTALLALLTAVVAGALVVPADPARAAPDGVTATEVSFTGSGGVVLHGTVLTPASGTGRHPGIVMLEGAGNRGRGYLMPDARAYARHGIVTLVYDKRTVGYSLLHRDYSVLADDALAGVRLLRSRPDTDPGRVGLWALSEGAFVAPIAANRSADVAFLITVGAVGTTVAEQTAWEYGQYLRHAGVSGSLVRTMRGTAMRSAIGAHLFPEADFDPLPLWRQVRQPVLTEWGQLDRDAVPAASRQLIGEALRGGGNSHHTARVVPAVNHDLHVTADDGFDRLPTLPADYGDYEAAWIGNPTQPPAVQSLASDAGRVAPTLSPPAWYDSAWAQLSILAVLLVAFVAYPVAGLIRRVRRRTRGHSPRSARCLAVLGPVTIAGTMLYMLFMLASAAKVTGPVLAGRPVPWLVLQLLAAGTVVATVALAVGWWRGPTSLARRVGRRATTQTSRHHRNAAGPIQVALFAAGLLFIPWALHWGLLVP
ncbi:alpha/beta hydrolase family protein [Rugosimonospora africana]|uniref:Peptidase S9 prolyl oligopeptidase catalytic domain-containing protein n=1 Tax=Rugosimonospora africana TaxID=556532 RepID=A0A8J3R1I6_9ACTN|nr:hypothetical protein [Rugosimonospora africana]GIH19892.1 hypothetical protein Raf01_80640 [Rugosimonospora africana]